MEKLIRSVLKKRAITVATAAPSTVWVEGRPGQTGGKSVTDILVQGFRCLKVVEESGMRIKVQITLESGEGESEMVEVARLERGPLRSDTVGLSLAEARAILAGLEQTLVERQTAEFVAQAQRCSRCGRDRPCKGHHRIVVRTPFGKLKLDSPQLYRCPCEAPGAKSVSPLAESYCLSAPRPS
jgi:hypothetical protein